MTEDLVEKRSPWRTARLVGVAALVLLITASGIKDGIVNLASATSTAQWTGSAAELIYGAMGIPVLYGMFARRRWTLRLLVPWAAAVIVTAGVAPIAWGDQDASTGLGAGLGGAVLAGLVAWGVASHVNTGTRSELELQGAPE